MRGFHDGSDKPTTGFQAVISLALECKSVRLYGFAGTTSLDGHEMSADHGIEREHVLLRQLSEHTYDLMPLAIRAAWPATNVSVVC